MLEKYSNIIDTVTEFYGISREDLFSKKKSNNVIYPRRIAIYLLKCYAGYSISEICNIFNRDHATVAYSIQCITELKETNEETREEIATIIGRFNDKFTLLKNKCY